MGGLGQGHPAHRQAQTGSEPRWKALETQPLREHLRSSSEATEWRPHLGARIAGAGHQLVQTELHQGRHEQVEPGVSTVDFHPTKLPASFKEIA
jgi:hypothetical protein